MAGRTTGNAHGLTDQQVKFCHEYARLLNATQAYRNAGYRCKTDASTWTSSSQLLRNPKVRAYLGEILNLSEVSVIHQATSIALADITEVVAWDKEGLSPIPSDRLSVRARSAIKSIKCKPIVIRDEDGQVIDTLMTWEITMHDKLAALEKLMRKLSLYPKTEAVTEHDVLDKMLEMGIVPSDVADHANKIYSEARTQVRSLLEGDRPEQNTEQDGISEETYAQIRSKIMGIDAESPAALSTEISEQSNPGQDLS
jgi:phage terminase small subunit